MSLGWSTERLHIRPYRPADAEALVEAVRESLDSVGRWLPWCHPGYSLAEALDWIARCEQAIARSEAYDLGVFCRGSGQLLGSVAINQIRPTERTGNVGYWLRRSAQGRGLALEALAGIPALGFERLGLQRLEIVIALGNQPSRRLAERCGAVFEGVAARRLPLHGEWVDAWIYSLPR